MSSFLVRKLRPRNFKEVINPGFEWRCVVMTRLLYSLHV